MKPWMRWVVLGAAAVGIAILFVVLSPGDPDEDASPAPSPPASAEPTPSRAASPSQSEPPEPNVHELEVTVEGGDVEAPDRPSVRQGEIVLLVVKADVSDEVHVHGYDLASQVSPGRPARIRFRADLPGVFEVELEEAGRLLLELEVAP